MYTINGHNVSQAAFMADEDAFEQGRNSYIRPIYNGRGHHLGFAVYVGGEAVGRVFEQYKHAAILLDEIRSCGFAGAL